MPKTLLQGSYKGVFKPYRYYPDYNIPIVKSNHILVQLPKEPSIKGIMSISHLAGNRYAKGLHDRDSLALPTARLQELHCFRREA